MKIKKLILIFKQTLEVYNKAYKEKYNATELSKNHLNYGICYFCLKTFDNIAIYGLFRIGYYKNLITGSGYLFLTGTDNLKKTIKPRIEFLIQEIESLKSLLKEGYTEV